ncbi:MAG: DUF2651 family protein [Clostridia bacterium]|nr:DUF2651 family protein [Clostridia bacterium]
MNIILIFVIIPIATILFAIALQRLLRSPIIVAGVFLGIFLILAYTVFDTSFLILAILYTILAFITAFLSQLIFMLKRRFCNRSWYGNQMSNVQNGNNEIEVLSISGENNIVGNTATLDTDSLDIGINGNGGNGGNNVNNGNSGNGGNNGNNGNGGNGSNGGCNSNETESVNVFLNAEVQPNSSDNGTTGRFRGCYRRR